MAYYSWSLSFLLMVLATSLIEAQSTTTALPDPPQPSQTACGTIVNDPNGNFIFEASLVFECLTSVPFNPAVATRFLKYYNDTLSFQSTLSYLKSPPPTYQQPSVDLLGGIQSLQEAVNSGSFANQYEFEAALQLLLLNAHDDHLFLSAGIMSAFTFSSPFDIVSLSVDGVEAPKVYIATDVFDSNAFTSFQPSAIKSINGENATTYLETFAARNVAGSVEPHTDWNRLMFSFAQDIQGFFNVFGGETPFYPGDSTTFEFENGTAITEKNLGLYWSQGPTGPLETGGDFYNFFVLGFLPASFNASALADPTTVTEPPSTTVPPADFTPSPLSWNSPAYPARPDIAQPGLGFFDGGFISGYFLNTSSVSVLSIPSFDGFGDVLDGAQDTVDRFIRRSQQAGLQKVVIDLQQNSGGQVLLAVDTFKRFFPNIEPFGGSRMRAHHSTNVMGKAITDYFDQLPATDPDYGVLSTVEWVATTRIDADTDTNFTSWDQFFGPVLTGDDTFTKTQQFNLSNKVFVDNLIANEGNFTVTSGITPGATPPWAPEDIIILTDGVCSSACALFVEMMHHEAGVRVVTVGGRPTTGPMQAVGGTRGARSFPTDILDNNIDFARDLLANTSEAGFLPNRTEALDVFIVGGAINLRDQVRRGETTPLQFTYEAADCRIFFTPETIFNYTALWQYAADAIWTDSRLCVAGSTGYATTGRTNGSEPPAQPPPISNATPFNMADHVYIDPNRSNSTADVEDAGELSGDLLATMNIRGRVFFRECANFGDLDIGCAPVLRCRDDTQRTPTAVRLCNNVVGDNRCFDRDSGTCQPFSFPVVRSGSDRLGGPVTVTFTGFCNPVPRDCNRDGSASTGFPTRQTLTTSTQTMLFKSGSVSGQPRKPFTGSIGVKPKPATIRRR